MWAVKGGGGLVEGGGGGVKRGGGGGPAVASNALALFQDVEEDTRVPPTSFRSITGSLAILRLPKQKIRVDMPVRYNKTAKRSVFAHRFCYGPRFQCGR